MTLDVKKELNFALQKAVKDYLTFEKAEAPTDTKGFSAYHTACKTALLHVALLIKLTQNETASDTIVPDLSALLEQAKKELNTDDFPGIRLDLG